MRAAPLTHVVLAAVLAACGASAPPPAPPPTPVDPAVARQKSWQDAFNAGVAAYKAGDKPGAITSFEKARGIDPARPDAAYNLAIVSFEAADYPAAFGFYKETIERLAAMPAPSDAKTAGLVVETRAKCLLGLLAVGARQFDAGQFDVAADSFRALLALTPSDRDARFNLMSSLFKAEKWDEVLPAAAAVLELDPLNENVHLAVANALEAQAKAAGAAGDKAAKAAKKAKDLEVKAKVKETDALPFYVEAVGFTGATGAQHLTLTVVGNAAAPGAATTLRFRLTDAAGNEATVAVAVTAPGKGEKAQLDQAVAGAARFLSYAYAVE